VLVDGKTIIKILKEHGWEHISTHGSHHKMKKSGMPPIVVPVHGKKDLKPGTLRNIERVTGIKLK
jgi:predicted RNA binding protein YcfA (HicA-like mRNA interferase family)